MFFCSVSFSLLEHLEALACYVNVLLCARQIHGSYVKKKNEGIAKHKIPNFPFKIFYFFPSKKLSQN